MARPGEALENPLTRERCTWLLTAQETGGRLSRAEWRVRPGGAAPAGHVHARSEERFALRSGRMGVEVGGRRAELRAGDAIALPAGVPHRWWIVGDEELVFVVEVEPALRFEQTIEALFGFARERRRGLPRLLQLAVFARHFGDEAWAASPPRWVQRALVAPLAVAGRLAGYGATGA
jgi:mannose-6-phosphate isomerase-like protein (cupin superfamily)